MEQYQYKPLPSSTSTRLIRFHPCETSDGISCSFVVIDTTKPPPYIALSYVWGDPKDTVPITIEGQAPRVTRNLKDALQMFSKTAALIWADALCINQRDIPERNQQVNMMSAIYLKAAAVMAWLGPDEYNDAPSVYEDVKAIIEGCGMIVEAGGQFGHFDEETGDLHWQLKNGQNFLSAFPKAIVDPDKDELSRLKRFFRLPWFSRAWIMQEVGVASETVVSWGGAIFEWAPIGLMAMFLVRYCKPLLRKLGLTYEVERASSMYTTFSPFAPRATFLQVLNNARRCDATDPRDKIFALLSHPTAHTISMTTVSLNWNAYKAALPLVFHFLSSLEDQFFVKSLAESRAKSYTPPNDLPPSLLKADYNKHVDDVYLEFAVDHITRMKSLDVLTAVQHRPEDISSLFKPSWVPRWDYFSGASHLGFLVANILPLPTRMPY